MKSKLHFFKQVLETVSFDANLFAKELKKAKTNLLPYELEQLYKWVHEFVKTRPELSELSLVY